MGSVKVSLTRKFLVTSGDIELLVRVELKQHGNEGRRLIGEINSDTRLYNFRLARRLQMYVEHKIGAGIDLQRHALGKWRQHSARL